MKSCVSLSKVMIVILVGILFFSVSIYAGGWQTLPTDQEIQQAVQAFIQKENFEQERVDCNAIQDPTERQICYGKKRLTFVHGSEQVYKAEVIETETVKMHHPSAPNPINGCEVILLFAQKQWIENVSGEFYTKIIYSKAMLEWKNPKYETPGGWEFSTAWGLKTKVNLSDRTSKEQRDAQVASYFLNMDKEGYYGYVRGFPGEGNRAPKVTLSSSHQQPSVYDTVIFSAKTEDSGNDPLTFIWFVDDEKQEIKEDRLELEGLEEGWHTVRVLVDDGHGGMAEDQLTFPAVLPMVLTITHQPTLEKPLSFEISLQYKDARGNLHPLPNRELTIHLYNIANNWAKLKNYFWCDSFQSPIVTDMQKPMTIATKSDGRMNLTFFPDFAKILAYRGYTGVCLPSWNQPLDVSIRVEHILEHPNHTELKVVTVSQENRARLDYMAYVSHISVKMPDVVTAIQQQRYAGDTMALSRYELIDAYQERWSVGDSRVQFKRGGFASISGVQSGWGKPVRIGQTLGAGDAVLIDARNLLVKAPSSLPFPNGTQFSDIQENGLYIPTGYIQIYLKYLDLFQGAVKVAEKDYMRPGSEPFQMVIGNPDNQFDDYAFMRWLAKQGRDQGIEWALTKYTIPVIGKVFGIYSTLNTLHDVARFGNSTYIRIINTAYHAMVNEDGNVIVSTRKGEVSISTTPSETGQQKVPAGSSGFITPTGQIRVVTTDPDLAKQADQLLQPAPQDQGIAKLPIVSSDQALEPVLTFLGWMMEYWYISILVALALLFGSYWFPYIAMGILGFLAGMYMISPWIIQIPLVTDWFAANPGSELPMSILTGLATLLLGFLLFKFLYILAGFITGGLLGFWLWHFLSSFINPEWLRLAETISEWMPWVCAGAVALVCGLLTLFARRKTISWVSILAGSLILSLLFVNLLAHYFTHWMGSWDPARGLFQLKPLGFGVFIGSFILFMITGFLNFRKRKSKHDQR